MVVDSNIAAQYLQEKHGVKRTARTLAKLRCVGGGPIFKKFGRSVIYDTADLDAWVAAGLSSALANTSQAA